MDWSGPCRGVVRGDNGGRWTGQGRAVVWSGGGDNGARWTGQGRAVVSGLAGGGAGQGGSVDWSGPCRGVVKGADQWGEGWWTGQGRGVVRGLVEGAGQWEGSVDWSGSRRAPTTAVGTACCVHRLCHRRSSTDSGHRRMDIGQILPTPARPGSDHSGHPVTTHRRTPPHTHTDKQAGTYGQRHGPTGAQTDTQCQRTRRVTQSSMPLPGNRPGRPSTQWDLHRIYSMEFHINDKCPRVGTTSDVLNIVGSEKTCYPTLSYGRNNAIV